MGGLHTLRLPHDDQAAASIGTFAKRGIQKKLIVGRLLFQSITEIPFGVTLN